MSERCVLQWGEHAAFSGRSCGNVVGWLQGHLSCYAFRKNTVMERQKSRQRVATYRPINSLKLDVMQIDSDIKSAGASDGADAVGT